MGKPKKGQHKVGSAIIKDRFGKKRHQHEGESFLHTSELEDGYDWGRLNLQSVTEQSNLQDFLATAELAGTEFTAEKLNVEFVSAERPPGLLTAEEEKIVKETQKQHQKLLQIPRRPEWDAGTSPEELDRKERESFLLWRRQLAELQEVEGLLLTPFEKNLEFWRQLWRVIEKSDAVVQIADARNPLLFRCPDLETYVCEVDPDKVNMVLINKADFLTQHQREAWAEYFDDQGLRVAFWSATAEAERQRALLTEGEEDRSEASDGSMASDGSEDEESERESETEAGVSVEDRLSATVTSAGDNKAVAQLGVTQDECVMACSDCHVHSAGELPASPADADSVTEMVAEASLSSHAEMTDSVRDCSGSPSDAASVTCKDCGDEKSSKNNASMLTGDELVELLRSLPSKHKSEDCVSVIGMVGYPNVGKSSTINAILQTKKVPVSATPGRTKHFQTLFVDPTLMLCDCPGLVMPTFVSTKADLVLSGILPIDQMRDFVPPVTLLGELMPRDFLEAMYGILLPPPGEDDPPDQPPSAYQLAGAYACMRGYMSHKGVPDYQRGSRKLLKDYVTGKMLYCHPPPGFDRELFHPVAPITKAAPTHEYTPHRQDPTITNQTFKEMDKSFFSKVECQMGVKGARVTSDGASSQGSVQSLVEKPWKKHHNRNKKEKLRKLHGHLDA